MAQNKKFSITVPLYKKNYETLDTFILHVKEQDYKNLEILFVHNSPDQDSMEFLHKTKTKKLLKGLEYRELDAGYDPKLGNGNHCAAFNLGALCSDGEYLLFLDPDVYLLPGILREYKDAFDQNPDVDFVYGDYDFEGSAGRIQGREYNEYQLRCANYISGGFPVRKSAFKGWNEKLESLQDWDMWLSVVDHGGKGLYIGRPCFTTAVPTKEGISANQADNWIERYNQVRNLHHFPVSKTVVTSLGAPLHATKAAQALSADVRVLNNLFTFKPHTYENIYVLGFYPLAWEAHMRLFYESGDVKRGIVGKKRIVHWIGTDIFQFQTKLSWVALKNIVGFLNHKDYGFVHLCEADFTQKELKELGIDAEVVPLPVVDSFKPKPLPEKFTVGVYTNPTQDMYYQALMEEIAEAMPDVDFKFFGNPNRKEVVDNKEYVGWVEMREFLPTISAIVRLCMHDGLPISPIEAMQMGRNALTSAPMKHALHAEYVNGEPDKAKVIEQIRQLQDMPLNEKASTYWQKEASTDTYRTRMKKYL